MSDVHTRTPMTVGLLSEVENRNKDKKTPFFVIDGGDFCGDNYPMSTTVQMYLKFKENNPNAKMVFNLGNTELEAWYLTRQDFVADCGDVLKQFAKNGINIVNATLYKVSEKNDEVRNYVKPYIVLDDIVDGKKQKVLITGFTQRKIDKEKDKADTKELLRTIVKPAIDKEKPDSIIFMMHAFSDYTNDILDYAKKDLEIKNIDLVVGGHPHSIEDYNHGQTRVLYSAPNGKACFEINHTNKGYEFDRISLKKDHYDYSPLLFRNSVIANININNPIRANEDYRKILDSTGDINQVIVKSPCTFKTRDDYNYKYSIPSELGTFMANSVKNATKADIGIMLTMDFRERFPQKGQNITLYNINDVVNVDKDIYKIEDVSVKDLKNIFEISLKSQDKGKTNSDFLEYSSNIKIERKIDDSENKVVQIYIKENGKWQKLLNENAEPIDKERKFTIGTCKFIATGGRESLSYFKTLKSTPVKNVRTRNMLIKEMQDLAKKQLISYGESIMITV